MQWYNTALDNTKSKLYKPQLPKITKILPDSICHVQFFNKGIELIDLSSIFSNDDFASLINCSINFPAPTVVCNLPQPMRSTIFNFNKVTLKSMLMVFSLILIISHVTETFHHILP